MIEQLRLLLRQLSPVQRIVIGGGAIGSILLMVLFVSIAGQPNYQAAFTGLAPKDAGTISEALRTKKIPFQMADAGATILVPAASVSDARIAAAAAGATSEGGTGFELFDKSGFGMSNFNEQVTYQRALDGELSRTISSLSGVSAAHVSVVAAQTGVFTGGDKAATASVVIGMRNGQPPDAGMVRAIVGTVSSSVAGLTPANVTVVDEQGHVLAGPDGVAAAGGRAAQVAMESDLTAKVQSLVDQALGPGHASVAVSASMDFDKVQQEITTYTPGAPVSLFRKTEQYAGATPAAVGGIPGAGSNVGFPTYPGAAAAAPAAGASAGPKASAGNGYASGEETVNYNLSQTIEKISREPGVVKRLSVAVLVDQKLVTPALSSRLQTTIAAAIGSDVKRGDVVAVSAVAFPGAVAAVTATDPARFLQGASGVAGTVLAGIVALMLLVLVWRNMRALRQRADEMALLPAPVRGGLLEAGATPTAQTAIAAGAASAAIAAYAPTQSPLEERLRLVADQKPEALAGLMQRWLREDGVRR